MNEGQRTELSLDDLLNVGQEELERFHAAKKVRDENPYLLDLIKVLYPHPNGLSRSIVIHMVEKNRAERGNTPVEKPEEAIQSSYNRFCIDSAVFKKRKRAFRDEAIFYTPGGTGSGKWGINQANAQAWLKRHGIKT